MISRNSSSTRLLPIPAPGAACQGCAAGRQDAWAEQRLREGKGQPVGFGLVEGAAQRIVSALMSAAIGADKSTIRLRVPLRLLVCALGAPSRVRARSTVPGQVPRGVKTAR